MLTPPRLALLAAAVTVLLWASAFVGIRAAAEDLDGGPLALARLLVAALVLGAIVAVRRDPLPPRADLGRLAACGLLWFAAYNIALNEAEQRVDAGTAAMLVNIGPVLIAILAGWLLREGFPRSLVTGCAIAFVGAIVIGAATSERSSAAGVGALLCLLAAATYAAGVVAQKPLLERASAMSVTFGAIMVATVACLPFAPELVGDVRAADGEALAWTVYLGVFPTAIGFTTWAFALKRTTAGKMGATTYLVPPVAVLMGWAILGETPPGLAFVGGALCLVGVAVTRRTPRAREPRRPGRRRPADNPSPEAPAAVPPA